jgi:choline dehydrogenase-like flavoprotein
MVGDSRWSYEGLLPYLRKIESHFDPKRDKDVHGYDGPIKTESVRAANTLFVRQ